MAKKFDFKSTIGRTRLELFHGDCVVGMSKLPPATVDVVVTSPPYNLGIQYGTYDDDQGRDEYLKWSEEWAGEIHRVLKENGSLFLNIGSAPSNPLLPHQLALKLSQTFVLQNTFHWIKSITVDTRDGSQISVGHFKPVQSKRYVTDCHEYIFHFTKTGSVTIDRLGIGVPYADKSNISRWSHTKGLDKRCRGNNWFIPYRTIRSRGQRPHPASFPVEMAVRCIRLHGTGNESVVLDPFLGIGNAAVAAMECEVARFLGFEVDLDFLAEAENLIINSRTIFSK